MIKVSIPNSVAYEMDWISFATKGTRKSDLSGYLREVFHWHCYRDWEFRLDKIGAVIHDRDRAQGEGNINYD